MTLISTIIDDAFRQANLTAVGTSPTTAQSEEALRYLQRILLAVLGYEAGEGFEDWPVGTNNVDDWFVPRVQQLETYLVDRPIPTNTRLILNLTEAEEYSLHPMPSPGSRLAVFDASANLDTNPLTLTGNGRLIEGASSLVINTPSADMQWFYREDQGNWARISPVATTDESPFPQEFDEFLILGLLLKLLPAYGMSFTPEMGSLLGRYTAKFRARYKQRKIVGSELGLRRLSFQGRPYYQVNGDRRFILGTYDGLPY